MYAGQLLIIIYYFLLLLKKFECTDTKFKLIYDTYSIIIYYTSFNLKKCVPIY